MSKTGNGNGSAIDAIAAERMRLAGLVVPGEVSAEHAAWEREVLRENNAREMVQQLLCSRELTVDQAFELAVEFVAKAFDRMDAIQRRRPGAPQVPRGQGAVTQ